VRVGRLQIGGPRVSGFKSRLNGGRTIPRRRFQPSQRDTVKHLRINDEIRISPIRLIDHEDNQIGIVDLAEAKRRTIEAGLDLVEVAPGATPPVCRIMDYGKWKYQQKKKEQKNRSHAKQSELKEVRLRPKIDDHDLGIKLEKARGFLNEGDKVQFTMLFRGREMAHRDLAVKAMREIRDKLADLSKVETEPRSMGRRMTMVLVPDRKPKPSGEARAERRAKPAPEAEPPEPAASAS
jgi:translation initiation factor IF-3